MLFQDECAGAASHLVQNNHVFLSFFLKKLQKACHLNILVERNQFTKFVQGEKQKEPFKHMGKEQTEKTTR